MEQYVYGCSIATSTYSSKTKSASSTNTAVGESVNCPHGVYTSLRSPERRVRHVVVLSSVSQKIKSNNDVNVYRLSVCVTRLHYEI